MNCRTAWKNKSSLGTELGQLNALCLWADILEALDESNRTAMFGNHNLGSLFGQSHIMR